MALEVKEILDYLSIDGVEKLEDFRSKFEPTYIKKDKLAEDKELLGTLFAPKIGKMAGAAQTSLISDLKKMGVEVTKDELKELPLEKLVEYGLKKASDHFSSKIAELEKSSGTGSDEKIKEIQEKFQKLEGKYEQTKNLLDETKHKFEAEQQSWQTEKKNIKLQSKVGDVLKSIKWKTGVSEIEKKGFLATINEKYKLDMDEKDDLFIADSTGQRIPHPKKNGEWKNINEILEDEGKAANVWEGNPIAGRATPQKPIHQNNPGIQQPAFSGGRQRVLSDAARTNEGK